MALKKFENYNEGEMIRIYPTQDESNHWYILPYEDRLEFSKDLYDEPIDDNEFDNKWGKYRTGGDLNLMAFYGKKEDLNNL